MSNIVYAVHNFEAENEDEINFSIGEPIVVLEKDEKYLDGWWQGRNIKGETGLFPMNYTSPQYMSSPHLSTHSSVEEEIEDSSTRLQTKVEHWNSELVAQWLKSVGFESIAHNFIDQEITGDILLDLNIEALKELGINTFGKRYKIMQAITTLKDEFSIQKLKPHTHLPPVPNASVSTSAISNSSSNNKLSTRLRRSNSQSTITTINEGDGLYQFPRKAPLPPVNANETNHLTRPLSPQSLSSSGVNDWSLGDITQNSSGIKLTTSKSTPSRQSTLTANTHKLSVSPFEESSDRASTTESFVAPEHEGWLHKQSDKYKTWNKRWFVLKGTNLFYFKSPKDVRMKGIINLRGYRIIVDETIHAGKYCFKAQHDFERTFYFYTDSEESMRTWLKMLMKTTIVRDFKAPVMSSNQIATVPLEVARRMRPRPPSVIMYQKPTKSNNDAKMTMVVEEEQQQQYPIKQTRESGITHHIIQEEEEEEEIPDIPTQQHQQQQHQFALEEEEDLIDPQHRSLPLSSSHQSMTSTISEEEEEEEEQEGQWDVTQYIRWANSYLPPGKKVVDLASAFRNGDALILLLETISQKTVRRPPVQKGGSVSVMMLDNIVAAFKFMGREGVDVDGRYTIKDVFGGNEEKIMTMLDAIKDWADANYLKPRKKSDNSVLISEQGSWRGSAMMDHCPKTEDEY
ncbi:hypothetical protein RO3G_01661 [Rhizopus delemar RA 99-880]|uniref:Polar growth protein n=1 Tax=Rhizopus delemar (strain RA 99-880 / ATCC MYA-4621 / FGSC 9543 / NRRL 43880) TaxID=246409 RepID=I1BL77_RHIO9|nr:hypothetical protein RO3G_01661 [Rhizopus delemar RA 99-880]|eukprot:EIE76957.1 hypothetical protein RO3G_01661 [Rhizopus delemar RA 99-880]